MHCSGLHQCTLVRFQTRSVAVMHRLENVKYTFENVSDQTCAFIESVSLREECPSHAHFFFSLVALATSYFVNSVQHLL